MKIITISDSPTLFSGLARVHRHIIDALVEDGHEVIPCAWFAYDATTLDTIKKGGKAPELWYDSNGTKVRMLCVPKGNGMNCMYAMYDVCAAVKPDIVITSGDFWNFFYMQALKVKVNFSFKWIAYLTMEHSEIEDRWHPLFRYADAIVSPSVYGQRVIESLGFKCHLIPYGTEKAFKRLPETKRRELRKARGCDDKVRFITVAQNTVRKNLPSLALAAQMLDHRDPSGRIQFYVHTNVCAYDPQETYLYDLQGIVDKLGVSSRFSFPSDVSIFSSPSDDVLRDEYNASDFFVLPSTCEGYGLPLVEAMACGLPGIANSTSTTPEHLGADDHETFGVAPRGFLVSNKTEVYPPSRLVRTVRPEAMAQAVWEMATLSLEKSSDLEGMRKRCEEYARERTWPAMHAGLSSLVKGITGQTVVPVEIL